MKEQLFYIQEGSSFHGNSAVWWGENSCGYTSDLSRAGKYTKEEAKQICSNKSRFERALPCDYIDQKTHLSVDVQYIDRQHSRCWIPGRRK